MDRLEILHKLSKGEISSEEAFNLLMGQVKKSPEIFRNVKFEEKAKPRPYPEKSKEYHETVFPIIDDTVSLDLSTGKYVVKHDKDVNEIRVQGDGNAELIDKSVKLYGKFNILIPKVSTINITLSSAELEGEVFADTVNIVVRSGSLYAKSYCQVCNIKNRLGTIIVSFNKVLKVLNVTNKLGSVHIRIPRSFNGIINTSRKFGTIKFSSDIIFSHSKFGKYAIGNRGDSIINVVTKLGTVEISYDTGREIDEDLQIKKKGGTGR